MLAKRIIPCLDVKAEGGEGTQFLDLKDAGIGRERKGL